jgi:hypothetical protein
MAARLHTKAESKAVPIREICPEEGENIAEPTAFANRYFQLSCGTGKPVSVGCDLPLSSASEPSRHIQAPFASIDAAFLPKNELSHRSLNGSPTNGQRRLSNRRKPEVRSRSNLCRFHYTLRQCLEQLQRKGRIVFHKRHSPSPHRTALRW